MKKRDRLFVATNLGPAVICFLAIFAYPLLRTILMSFYKIPAISSPMSKWEFVGFANYSSMFTNSLFLTSLKNISRIWLVGGVLTIGLALMYAVIIASGVKGKSFGVLRFIFLTRSMRWHYPPCGPSMCLISSTACRKPCLLPWA